MRPTARLARALMDEISELLDVLGADYEEDEAWWEVRRIDA